MSRSGYSDDFDEYPPELWQQAVIRAFNGRRGQAFLKEMRDALIALPNKRLIRDELVTEEGEVCAIGAVGRARGIDMSNIYEGDPNDVGNAFGIARAMAAEIEYENDECFIRQTPEERYERMLRWIEAAIIPDIEA